LKVDEPWIAPMTRMAPFFRGIIHVQVADPRHRRNPRLACIPVLEIDVKKSVESFFKIGKQWTHEHNAFD